MYASAETKTSMTYVDQNGAGRPLRTRVKPLGQTQLGTQRLINLFQLKSKTRIGCLNVRTLFQASKLTQLASELRRCGIAVIGVAVVRWNTIGEITTTTGETGPYNHYGSSVLAQNSGYFPPMLRR